MVEIVRVNKDESMAFPNKVEVPTLSLTSLIKFGECAEISNSEDRGRLLTAIARRPTSSCLDYYTTRPSKPSETLCALNWPQPTLISKGKMVSIATLTHVCLQTGMTEDLQKQLSRG